MEYVQAEVLKKFVANTPEVRPEVVARAKQLIAEVQYPPSETVHKLASLLNTKERPFRVAIGPM